jgi:tetratricopeptide (TPR) repeat protein
MDCGNAQLDAAEVHFRLGSRLEAEGQASSALTHYLHAAELADGPLVVSATYRAGLLALRCGDLAQATSLLDATRTAAGAHPAAKELAWHAAYWLGMCCELDDRVLEAIALYEDVARSGEPPLKAEARYRRLQALASIGELAGALQVADELIESDRGGDERIGLLAGLAAEEKRQLLRALEEA